MKKIINCVLVLTILAWAMYSCEPEDETPDTGDSRDKLVGDWMVDEVVGVGEASGVHVHHKL